MTPPLHFRIPSIMKKTMLVFFVLFSGCAGTADVFGTKKLDVPPEFNQKILLAVSDEYQMHQAPRSGYDIGDLQAFHSQHTLPIVIEDAFKEMFGEVEMVEKGPKIETDRPDVPAIFEVRIIDMAHDIYNEATTYRSNVTLAVAMKSPRDQIFWQQAFRGEGYVVVDDPYSTGLGPKDAVLDAMRDAIDQMQKAIASNPEVHAQMKHYKEIEAARRQTETKI